MKAILKLFFTVFVLSISFSIKPIFSQQIWVSFPAEQQEFASPASLTVATEISGIQSPEPAYIQVNQNITGYRKLKIGNNPNNLSSPFINLLAGGNDKVEITLRDFGGNCNWSKVRFRPQAKGTLSLGSYVSAVGGIGNSWKKITIPLVDFGTSVNFLQVAFIEFPYSADAGPFNIGFSEIKFTGGTTPYVWFGQEKTNIIHDGTTYGAGGLPAILVPSVSPNVFPAKVEFYLNDILVSEDNLPPYSTNLENLSPGNYSLVSRMVMNDFSIINSLPVNFTVKKPEQKLFINIDSPSNNSVFEPNSPVQIQTSVVGASPSIPSYLLVSNQLIGYRKLKFGYNPNSIYSSENNVLLGGNNKIEITLKAVDNQVTWTNIQIRPTSLGSLSIYNYVVAAGSPVNEWFTITIPISDFNSSIDFTKLAYMEFPYSASAGNFQIAIKSIKFTGGTTPFVWFGDNKTDNSHDGFGGTGQLVANLITGNASDETIEKVELFVDDQKVNEDYSEPYFFEWSQSVTGEYSIFTKVTTTASHSAVSEPIIIDIFSEIPEESPLSVELTQPLDSTFLYAPASLTLEAGVSGLITNSISPYLEVVNTETGYRKLKLGYTPDRIYGPTQNVVSGGNTTLEITMINLGNPVDWSKINIRPVGIGSLSIANYISAAGGIENVWKTISIPLTDFGTQIDFTKINYIEFPYSSNAGAFKLGISAIKFTGGSTPFIWFGDGKYDNPHDGTGGTSQLFASMIMPPANPITVSKIEFFKNGVLLGETLQAPYTHQLQNLTNGKYFFKARLTDSKGSFSESDSVFVNVLSDIPEGAIVLNVMFDNPPSNLSVAKAVFRYNKDFAYSFSLDDTYRDAYTNAFTLMRGGYLPDNNTTYPGLFYTDGCGNDKTFTGALMWNSVNSNYSDIHVNTPNYLTWEHLTEMVNSGWNVINHTYSHAYGTNTDYAFQVNKNVEVVFEKTGFTMKHFTTPSGDNNYVPVAFANGMKSITQNNSSYLGYPNGLKTDNPLNFNQLKLYRRFLYDGLYNITNISQNIDNAANLSVNGNHYWYSDFTHRVGFQQINGSLVFPTLEFYMKYIADTYGKNGTDRVWMAGYQDVYEYLAVRDYSILRWNLNQNQLQIIIERTNIPTDLEKYALSLVIDANANIINVSSENITGITWNNKEKKLINLDWTPTALENITNSAGVTNLKKAQILNPIADFIYTPTAPNMDQQVSFTNNSLMQNISSYTWDIGNDGIIDYTTKDIIHAFSLAGSYPVKLTVSNGTTSLDVTKTVTVTDVVNDIIIDDANAAPLFTLVGTWNNSGVNSGRYGSTSKVPASATNTNAKAIFTPNILVPGVYQIFESHTYNSNRENAARFTITHKNGSSAVTVNQQSAATSFSVSLGEFEFNAGTTGFVTLTELSGPNGVNADALKFVYKGPLPATSLKSITDFNGRKNESINISDNGLKFGSLLNVTNYPNPFSSSTTIYWEALVSDQTTLEVTDVFGRKIKTLVNEFKSQGEHTVRFDSEALSEGIYFYQLKLGNSIVTKKMMIKK